MRISLMWVLAAWLSACSPEHNWRQIVFDGTSLTAQLPCKPDRTIREMPLGGVPTQVSVAGCMSGPVLLAVMTAPLAPGMDAQRVLEGWQQATWHRLQRSSSAQAQPWVGHGMLALGAAQRVQAQGQRSDGQPVVAHAVWGAFAQGQQIHLVHAVVYAPTPQPDLAQTLFDGLQP